MGDAIGLVIDGGVVPGEAGTYPVTNPVRPAEVVFDAPSASRGAARPRRGRGPGRVPVMGGDGARRAGRARRPRRRPRPVPRSKSQDLATLLTREHGKVLWEAQFDSGTIGGMAGAFAPLVAEALASRSLCGGGRRTSVVHEPYGVVAALLPFNWPVSVLGNKVLPALLAGNTVVVKAPPTCPGAVLAVAAALADALPPGVVNAVNGPAPELGEMLVSHPGVDMVSFTGGVPTGRAVMAAASGAVRPVVLELGGNDPAIVAPDVDIDDALADKIVGATFITSGQVCMAIKRLYVPEDKVRAMVDALVARVGTEVVGDGLAPEVTMGPVHRPAARQRVEAMLEEAAERGARVHRPGRVRDEDAVGRWLPGVARHRRRRARRRPDRVRGAVRTGAPGHRLQRRRRGRAPRQRLALRAVRIDLDRRRGTGRRHREPARGGHGVREQPRHRGDGPPGPVRRMEAVGLRARARTRGNARLHPPEDHPPVPGPVNARSRERPGPDLDTVTREIHETQERRPCWTC